MKVNDLLSELEAFEEIMRLYYEKYAGQLTGKDDEAAAFFARLSREEKSHWIQIREVRRVARLYLDLDNRPLGLDEQPVRQAAGQVRTILTDGCSSALPEMLARAFWCEQFALEKHAGKLLAAAAPLDQLLETLQRADEDHVQAIRNFAAGRNIQLPAEGPAEKA